MGGAPWLAPADPDPVLEEGTGMQGLVLHIPFL